MKRLVVSVVVMVGVALSLAATATASCNPNRSNSSGNWHDGWYAAPPSGTCINGSAANIEVYSPYVAAADVTAWVMLFNNSTNRYGQVGWYQNSNGFRWNFTESDTATGGFHQNFFSPSSIGADPQYKITFSSNAFHYFISGTNINTDTNTGYTGCWSEQMGEVTSSANQMPGGYNSPDYFILAQVRRADTSAWYNTNGTPLNDNSSWYNYSKVSSSEIDIWDRACAS